MRITVTLPWPDKRLSPNARVHWRVKADCARQAKETGYFITRQVYTPGNDDPFTGALAVTYHFYPPDRHDRDDDNLVASLKAARDGVAKALLVDDKQFKMQTPVWHDPIKGGQVVMIVEEMP